MDERAYPGNVDPCGSQELHGQGHFSATGIEAETGGAGGDVARHQDNGRFPGARGELKGITYADADDGDQDALAEGGRHQRGDDETGQQQPPQQACERAARDVQ